MNGEHEITLSFSTLLFCDNAIVMLFTTIVNSNIDYHYLPSGFSSSYYHNDMQPAEF